MQGIEVGMASIQIGAPLERKSLQDLLSIQLILSQTVPYLDTPSLLHLSAASKDLRSLLVDTYPSCTFRRLDLSTLPSPLLQAITSSTEATIAGSTYRHTSQNADSVDDYYAAPLRRVFYVLKRTAILNYVTTLVLDRLTVPAALLREILCDEPFNVRILSLRGVKNLGDEKLIQILRYLIRPSRPKGIPKLKGLYYFTSPECVETRLGNGSAYPSPQPSASGVTTVPGSHLGNRASSTRSIPFGSLWTEGLGNLFHPGVTCETWAQLIEACQGIIAFDTVVCRHGRQSSIPPRIASIALGACGCQQCHAAPEPPLTFGQTPAYQLPLLPPPPLFSSTVKAGQSLPMGQNPAFYARCTACMKDRRCEQCNSWWCENCYTPPCGQSLSQNTAGAEKGVKVHLGLCVSHCLVEELYTGAGEGGMWG
ncbi:MAG: hypothetical protein Q9174_003950 [Haloplaca sp. 1 TL-2023]